MRPAASSRRLVGSTSRAVAALALVLSLALLTAACGNSDSTADDEAGSETTGNADQGSSTSDDAEDATATTGANDTTSTTAEQSAGTTSAAAETTESDPGAGTTAANPTDDTANGNTANGNTAPDNTAAASGGTGSVIIRLEPVEGYFIEGFEIGLRLKSASGDVVASTLWSDHIAANGDGSIDAWYETDLTVSAPSGALTVEASANVGMGPAPVTPDLNGPLRCSLSVDVPANGTVVVEVGFDQTDCLRQLS